MGGAKRKSLAQAEKQQQLQASKQEKTAQKAGKAKPKIGETKFGSREIGEEGLKELAGIKALTPFSVATKFGVKLSVAKDMLETLEKRKAIEQVASGRGLKVYKLTGNT